MIPVNFKLAKFDTLVDLYNLIKSSNDEYVAIDTETTGLRWMAGDRAFGVALAWDDRYTFIRNEDYGVENISSLMSDLYELRNKTVVMHNAEFDLHMIRETYGIDKQPVNLIDTLRVSHILDTSADHSLKGWGANVYGSAVGSSEDILKSYMKAYNIKNYAQVSSNIMDPYACMDVALTKCLAEGYANAAQKMSPRWFDYEHDLIPIVMDITRNGILIDFDYMATFRRDIKRRLYSIQEEMFSIAGKMIKPGSSDSIANYMYNEGIAGFDLKESGSTVKAKGSADVAALTWIKEISREDNPRASKIAELILEWRKYSKQLTTYVEGMEKAAVNGRIHALFNALGTRTGRFSSSEPNMQNIPRDNTVKRLFRPDEKFYEFDYSQLEYRLAGVRSGEMGIMDAYIKGVDFHSNTAASLFGIPIEQITKKQRNIGKTINFLTLYAGGPKSLALKAGIPLADAKVYHAKYWKTYPELQKYIAECSEDAETNRYVHTMLGRKVPIHNLFYAAPNYEIQGTGGDMIKISLIRVNEIIKGTGIKIRNTVHDSIFLDNTDESIIRPVREAMEAFNFHSDTLNLQMPIEVGVTTYDNNWGDGYEWEREEVLSV